MLVKVDCNLAAAVAEADYEDSLTAKGFSIPVFAAVHDAPGKVLLAGPRRQVRNGVVARRNNYSLTAIDAGGRRRNPPVVRWMDAKDPLAKARRKNEMARVPLQVPNHLFA
jgi:hypothetical protein